MTTESQAMITQVTMEVVPRASQQVVTMASHPTDITRINPPFFYGSKVEEDTQEFIYEIYKILYAMVLSTSEKAELDTYQLEDVTQTLVCQLEGK